MMAEQSHSIFDQLQADYEHWFTELQALSDAPLEGTSWMKRWLDAFTPTEALLLGPDKE